MINKHQWVTCCDVLEFSQRVCNMKSRGLITEGYPCRYILYFNTFPVILSTPAALPFFQCSYSIYDFFFIFCKKLQLEEFRMK